MYTDETLSCLDCGRSFTFTASEQEFFATKGFTNKPGRCSDCRAARKAGGGQRVVRPRHPRAIQSNVQSVRRRRGGSV